MNEISLIYYGELAEISNHLLYLLKVVKVMPAFPGYSGFYIQEKKFGFENSRKVSLDLNESEATDFLIYKYLSPEELLKINQPTSGTKYYILAHKLFDLDYIKDKIELVPGQFQILIDYTASSDIRSQQYAQKFLPPQYFIKINTRAPIDEVNAKNESALQLPVLLLWLAKILFNPVNELQRISILLKYSNLRLIGRFVELLIFFDFIIKYVLIKIIKQVYYKSVFLAGLLRVLVIKTGFLIRHILLMCGFKSFGFFVDLFNLFIRVKDFIVNFLIYGVWHFVLYSIAHFLYYKIFYFLYFKVGYFIYYRIICYVLVDIIYLKSIDLFYFLRHALYMMIFKTYGFVYDAAMFVHRFTKLVLLYPIRKTYWFCSFQYNKRLKKYFSNEA